MPFDRTPKVIHARRYDQKELKALSRGEGKAVFKRIGLPAVIRHDGDPRQGQQGTLKPMKFSALIPHHQVHGLPSLQVNPNRRKAKIVNNDLYLLIPGRTRAEAKQKERETTYHASGRPQRGRCRNLSRVPACHSPVPLRVSANLTTPGLRVRVEARDVTTGQRGRTLFRSFSRTMLKQVLTIAGSDSSGGAGIQADLKAMSANGTYAASVITSITAQNTTGVTAVHDLPESIVEAQIDAVFTDFDVAAVKTGMLSSPALTFLVSRKLQQYHAPCVVVDPVMISKSGQDLLQADAITALQRALIPLAYVITPNVHEAERLTGLTIRSLAEAREAAKALHLFGCQHVLITGGHLPECPAADLLYDGRFFHVYKGEWIDTPHTHGTGCTFASALAAHLALGKPLPDAVEATKSYVTSAIRHGLAIGRGRGPTNHFYFLS